ncbi:MAG: response regulator [Proteobacteria bacterium]|nr:response regulator [Pseudomonadota bacterium]
MAVIRESPEHHFLTLLEKIRPDISGWIGMHFALSRQSDHADLISNPAHIKGKLTKLQEAAGSLIKDLEKAAQGLPDSTLYLFSDCDIVLLARPQNEKDRSVVKNTYQAAAQKAGAGLGKLSELTKDIYDCQKLADEKLLGTRRFAAYEDMSDANRVASIPLRRQRRDDALVMIVEDDRFTATFAANILNKEYEMILAKTGEDAIISYIEHAPDIVFLDIHLPGLSGHETLNALRAVDPDAYIIMLSVDTVKENVVSASQGGAAGFLKKPFSKERMLQIVMKSPFVKDRKRSGFRS